MEGSIIWIAMLFILMFMLGVTVSVIIWSIRNGISPMPSSSKVKYCLLSVSPSKLKGTIYELGSGWGTLAFPLAKRYPSCRVVGFETSPVPYWVSRMRLFFHSQPNLHLRQHDFFMADIGDASLVVCYLYPGAMTLLKEKFQKELKPGTWVISNTFAIPGWQAKAVFEVKDIYSTKIYVYQKN